MDNFYAWVMNPLPKDDIETWFNMNNIILERKDLFCDFVHSLIDLIKSTYLGDTTTTQVTETTIQLEQDDKQKHFDWCWSKTIDAFSKENINFHIDGDHKVYFSKLLMDLFYNTQNKIISDNLEPFFTNLFDDKVGYSQSDLEMLTEIYKLLNKNLQFNN
jgi:hypothetical protein